MNTLQKNRFHRVTLMATLTLTLTVLLAGCDQPGQTVDSNGSDANVGQPGENQQLLGDVAEFDGFTIRANVSPTDHLPDAMAQQYGIEPDPDKALLTVVILENQPEQQPAPVSGELSAHYDSLSGQTTDIDMRSIEADGRVSYIGTLDASAQRVFQFVIEAQPEGADQPLQMNFDVELSELNSD